LGIVEGLDADGFVLVRALAYFERSDDQVDTSGKEDTNVGGSTRVPKDRRIGGRKSGTLSPKRKMRGLKEKNGGRRSGPPTEEGGDELTQGRICEQGLQGIHRTGGGEENDGNHSKSVAWE